MNATFFALALAAALLDATVGYPERLEAAIGSPARWLAAWLRTIEIAAAGLPGRIALVVYLAPPMVLAAALDLGLPNDSTGFVARAIVASVLCGRQRVDRRAREAARVWETEGPGEAMIAVEALGAREGETRLAPAAAAALGARFADEVVAPTLFIVLGGLVGAAFFRALAVAERRTRRDAALGDAVSHLERFTIRPAARIAALGLALVSGRRAPFAAVTGAATRATEPAEAAMLAALGPARRDEPGYLRDALALLRRAMAGELALLVVLTVGAAFAF